ncbi:hypothetical protein Nepgr_025257 [Nepenthes gracilis]|uniref:Uncharacterized protein n=1 Tax=Nepenthes gracilis TaxID=150966 RepID=A0AAD3Y0T3_NEPGR|nr:hypothetical protein Nepgr_025257 [Nepenthes gracilis]
MDGLPSDTSGSPTTQNTFPHSILSSLALPPLNSSLAFLLPTYSVSAAIAIVTHHSPLLSPPSPLDDFPPLPPPRTPLVAKNLGPSSLLAVGLRGSKGGSVSAIGLPPPDKLMDCGPQGTNLICPDPLPITDGDAVFGTNALNPVTGPSTSASPPVSWLSIVGQNHPQADAPLPSSVRIKSSPSPGMDFQASYEIGIEYQGNPVWCSLCNHLGYSSSCCLLAKQPRSSGSARMDGSVVERNQTIFGPSCIEVSSSGTEGKLMSTVRIVDQCRSPCLDNIDSRIVPLGNLASQFAFGNVDPSSFEQQIGPPESHPPLSGCSPSSTVDVS